jgi:flagellar motor switch protein FliN/FliY
VPRDPADETARVFCEGFFEVLGALLSEPVSFEAEPCAAVTPEEVDQALEQWPLVLEGRTADHGTAALLLTEKDGLRLAGSVFGKADKESEHLAEHDLATLKELGEHALKRALECVAARSELALTLAGVAVTHAGPVSEERLGPVLVSEAEMAGVRFSASSLNVDAVLLFPAAWSVEGPNNEAIDLTGGAASSTPGERNAILSEENAKKELGMAPDMNKEMGRGGGNGPGNPANLDMVLDIRLVVRARLGRIEIPIGDILALGPGSIVEIGRMLDDPVEVLVNDKLIARGDVVVVDEKFGLRITEIVSPLERIESLR